VVSRWSAGNRYWVEPFSLGEAAACGNWDDCEGSDALELETGHVGTLYLNLPKDQRIDLRAIDQQTADARCELLG